MQLKYKPFYLKFPIFQIIYILFWIPIGFIISKFCSAVIVSIVFYILSTILKNLFSLSFEMFILSGRLEMIVNLSDFAVTIILDFILLVLGLELISYFLNKKKINGGFDEHTNTGKI